MLQLLDASLLQQAAALAALHPHNTWGLAQLTSSLHAGYRLVGVLTPSRQAMNGAGPIQIDSAEHLFPLQHTVSSSGRLPPVLAGYYVALEGVDVVELLHICTHPAHLRQGFAGQLMADLQIWAQKLGKSAVWLEVREDNAAAKALYARQGFIQVGQRPNYYPAATTLTSAAPPRPAQRVAALQLSLKL